MIYLQVLFLYGNQNWDVAKILLITHFGYQRNESSLLSGISSLRQGHNETSLQFYSSVCSTLNVLLNYVNLHATVQDVIKSKKMTPTNLAEAQLYIIEDNNIRFLKFGNTQKTRKFIINCTDFSKTLVLTDTLIQIFQILF